LLRVVTPSLSTIKKFQHELDRVAAAMVIERLKELPRDTPGRAWEMPFEIVRRRVNAEGKGG
jgi:LacI family transcriptional regulator